MAKQRLLGLLFFGYFFIFTSLAQLLSFIFNYNNYQLTFGYLPPALIILRYSLSILGRVLHIIVGVGLLKRKEIFRKIAIWGAGGMIATATFRHPFLNIVNHTHLVLESMGLGKHDASMPSNTLVWIVRGCILFMDIIFYGTLMYYLTRPQVKSCFVKNGGS